MVAQSCSIPLGVYLTTRTRLHFERDAKSALAINLMPVEVVLSVVNSALGGSSAPSKEPLTERLKSPTANGETANGETVNEGEVLKIDRERKSRSVYNWYRRVSGRNYNVHNLDTRNASEFVSVTRKLGHHLSTR